MIDIGKMRHKIAIQRQSQKENEYGISSIIWADICSIWANVDNLYGKEYWNAKEYSAENALTFVIRYSACKDLQLSDRIKFGGKLYNILSIDNILYRNEVLKIKAIEVE
ncbi:MAG: phage head closure protein [Oscillospiraceae bacterium]